jgi:TRAP-type C4-dicarboxylate transport system substrate-binding protein
MLYFAYYDDEDCIQDYMLCDANNEKDAIQKFIEGRFSGITICHPERLKARRVNRPVEDIKDTVKLSDHERDYLADKTFWDWKRAEIDVMSIPLLFKDNKKAAKKIREVEKFYKDLYKRLSLEGE